MPFLTSVATALPPYELTQDTARTFARTHFADSFPNIERYLPVFEHAQIDTRRMVAPIDWFLASHSFKECNDLFCDWAIRLGEESARRCLDQAGLQPSDVDHLIYISTTGMASPSIDSYLINKMGMSKHTKRTPIWGLGCAGGVAGLARAYDYARAYPNERVLLINIELCSITFQWNDLSKRNLIAVSLFADGAAAVLVEGDNVARRAQPTLEQPQRLHILGTQSTLWPDTSRIMGWDMVDTGMQVVFSSRIPNLVQDLMHENVESFLAAHDVRLDDISHFVLHPGGAKIVRAYEQALAIDPERLHHTREVLRKYGNMSSATVFFVLQAFEQQTPVRAGEYALLAVLGPGFSCELALVQGQ